MAQLSPLNKLTLSLVLNQLCFSTSLVVFFPHLMSLGSTQLYIGSTASVISFIGLIWNPIAGSLSDGYGRKFILLRLLAIDAIGTLLFLITNSLVVIFVARCVSGFAAPLITIMNSYATDVLEKKDRESHYSRVPTVMAACMLVGPLIGGFVSELNNGYLLCFILIFIMQLLNIGAASTLPDTKQKKKIVQESLPFLQVAKKEVQIVVSKLNNVKWKEYSDIFSTKLCIELSCALFFQSIGPTYNNFGIQGRALGYLFMFMSVNGIVSNILLSIMKNKIYDEDLFGQKRLFHAAVMFFITSFILSYSNTVLTYSIGMLVMSFARTVAFSTFTEALMNKASDEDRGGISGAFESIASFCGLITPIGAGILIDSYGMKFILKMTFIPTIICLGITYREYSAQKKNT